MLESDAVPSKINLPYLTELLPYRLRKKYKKNTWKKPIR